MRKTIPSLDIFCKIGACAALGFGLCACVAEGPYPGYYSEYPPYDTFAFDTPEAYEFGFYDSNNVFHGHHHFHHGEHLMRATHADGGHWDGGRSPGNNGPDFGGHGGEGHR